MIHCKGFVVFFLLLQVGNPKIQRTKPRQGQPIIRFNTNGTDYRGALHQNSPKPQSVASRGSLHQNRQNPLSLGYPGAKFLPLPYMRVSFHFPHLDRVHAVVRQLYTHAPNCSDPSHVMKGPANHTLTLTAGTVFKHFSIFQQLLDSHCTVTGALFVARCARSISTHNNAAKTEKGRYPEDWKYVTVCYECKHYGTYESVSKGKRKDQE